MYALDSLGYGPQFEKSFSEIAREGRVPARVAEEQRGSCRLLAGEGPLRGEVSGRLRGEARGRADLPAVGDWVVARPSPGGPASIEAVLPRRTRLSRKVAGRVTDEQVVAANVDTVFIVTALRGDWSPRRLERYAAAVWEGGAQPVVLLSKADLCEETAERLREAAAAAPAVPVRAISALRGEGLEALGEWIRPGATVACVGSSGVGKSTLINRLAGEELLPVSGIRESDGRGRHTTTARQMILLPAGGILIDTPGMREFAVWDAEEGLQRAFADIEGLGDRCRFRDCGHDSEPGCAVREAVEAGSLDPGRLESWRRLGREQRWLERRMDPTLQAEERRRWRTIHRSMKVHRKRDAR